MKQENKFVAQLFHYLAPFVDAERDLFICVDGAATKQHAGRSASGLLDPDVPDLWLTLCGQSTPIGIEAKIIESGRISVRQSQLCAWRTGGKGTYRPRFWVTADRQLQEFSCWEHSTVATKLDASKSTIDNVAITLSKCKPSHYSSSIAQLALFILCNHRADGPVVEVPSS